MDRTLQKLTFEALQPLIGLPMWAGGRTVNLVWLQFGSKRIVEDRTGEKEVGEFALHLQCFWRIYDKKTILVASGDRFYPKGDPDDEAEDFDWTLPGANRCDEKLDLLFHSSKLPYLVVRSIRTDRHGGFSLGFHSSIRLDVFPDDTVSNEKWRLFRPYSGEAHFVVDKI